MTAPFAPKQPIRGAAITRIGQKMDVLATPDMIISPALVRFFDSNPEPTFPQELVEEVMAVFWAARPVRSARFSPSSLGDCARRQTFAYLDVPQALRPGTLSKIFFDGHMAHAKWQLILKHLGLAKEFEYFLKHPKLPIGGSMDVLGEDDKGLFVVDIKTTTMAPTLYEIGYAGALKYWDDYFAWEAEPNLHPVPEKPKGIVKTFVKYWRQLHGYMALAQINGMDLRRACLLMDLTGDERWREIVIPYDQRLIFLVIGEWTRLTAGVRARALPQVLDDCQTHPNPDCPYRLVCHKLRSFDNAVAAGQPIQIQIPIPPSP